LSVLVFGCLSRLNDHSQLSTTTLTDAVRDTACDCQTQECGSDDDVIKNPNCFKIYSDTHLFGGDREVAGSRENFEKNITRMNVTYPSFKERTFYVGDIVDLANTVESEKAAALKQIDNLRKSCGDNYIRGNHEMDSFGKVGENRKKIYKERILFLHGHTLRYSKDRADYWESGKRSEYKRGEWDESRTLDEVFTEAAKEAETNNCKIVVFGHTHPDSLTVRTINGIKIINVRKGCTYLYLPIDSVLQIQKN
jgi:predicted phosphodiesterase